MLALSLCACSHAVIYMSKFLCIYNYTDNTVVYRICRLSYLVTTIWNRDLQTSNCYNLKVMQAVAEWQLALLINQLTINYIFKLNWNRTA